MSAVITIGITTGFLKPEQITPVEGDPRYGFSYSIMHGNSPYFATMDELIAYYNGLPNEQRVKHMLRIDVVKRHICFYQHQVSMIDQVMGHGYNAKAGEILSTDEYRIFSLSAGKWDWEEGFDL